MVEILVGALIPASSQGVRFIRPADIVPVPVHLGAVGREPRIEAVPQNIESGWSFRIVRMRCMITGVAVAVPIVVAAVVVAVVVAVAAVKRERSRKQYHDDKYGRSSLPSERFGHQGFIYFVLDKGCGMRERSIPGRNGASVRDRTAHLEMVTGTRTQMGYLNAFRGDVETLARKCMGARSGLADPGYLLLLPLTVLVRLVGITIFWSRERV